VEHYPQIKALMDEAYPELGGAWPEHTLAHLIKEFPEGQIGIVDEGKLVGIALSIQVNYARFSNPHTYDDLVLRDERIWHNPNGNSLYGLDVFIDPAYRGYRLGRRLYEARKDLCRSKNLRAILAGGRIPNYHKYAEQYTPAEYIERVDRKEIYDPILSFQLANGFQVKRLLHKYLPEDEQSRGYATLLEWNNILYEPAESVLETRPTQVRVGAVQWQMREFASVEAALQQIEYFVDALSDYQSDFAVFPELFNAPLMGLQDRAAQQDQLGAIRFLAGFTERFKTELSRMAISYNINIIGGSMIEVGDDDRLYNIAYLFHRDGNVERQAKLHITPQERRD
jgi:GNAT superfamily N-acetyltransferase